MGYFMSTSVYQYLGICKIGNYSFSMSKLYDVQIHKQINCKHAARNVEQHISEYLEVNKSSQINIILKSDKDVIQ